MNYPESLRDSTSTETLLTKLDASIEEARLVLLISKITEEIIDIEEKTGQTEIYHTKVKEVAALVEQLRIFRKPHI